MSEPNDRLDLIRRILKEYDDGQLSYYMCEAAIGDLYIKSLLETIEAGHECIQFGSCCCSSHPPDRTFKAEITIQPHGFTARRCQ